MLELNAKNPPVWLRVTPKRIAYGGYRVVGGDIQLALTATALTETFVGPRPEPNTPTPLPPLAFDRRTGNAQLYVPVIASYAELEPVLMKAPRKVLTPTGLVWLTGVPVTEPGSRVVRVRDLTIGGTTDSPATNLLAQIALSPEMQATIGAALTENFERDYQKVLGKANAALASKRTGDFLLSAKLTDIENGRISAYGEGLYMPVTGRGSATIRYVP